MGCATSLTRSRFSNHKQMMNNHNDDLNVRAMVILSNNHKAQVLKTWKILSNDLTGRGKRIFLLIFQKNPRVKSLFPCGNLEGDALMKDPSFIGHASRFMQAVGAVVDNIDNYQNALAPLLNNLGRRHVYFKGFKPEYFNGFEEAILQVFAEDLGTKFTQQAKEAWRLVFKFILMELKRGFTECLRDKGLQRSMGGETLTGNEYTLSQSERDLWGCLANKNGSTCPCSK